MPIHARSQHMNGGLRCAKKCRPFSNPVPGAAPLSVTDSNPNRMPSLKCGPLSAPTRVFLLGGGAGIPQRRVGPPEVARPDHASLRGSGGASALAATTYSLFGPVQSPRDVQLQSLPCSCWRTATTCNSKLSTCPARAQTLSAPEFTQAGPPQKRVAQFKSNQTQLPRLCRHAVTLRPTEVCRAHEPSLKPQPLTAPSPSSTSSSPSTTRSTTSHAASRPSSTSSSATSPSPGASPSPTTAPPTPPPPSPTPWPTPTPRSASSTSRRRAAAAPSSAPGWRAMPASWSTWT